MEDTRNIAWRLMNHGLADKYHSYYPRVTYSYKALVAAFRESQILKEFFDFSNTEEALCTRPFRYHNRAKSYAAESFGSFCLKVPSPKSLPRYSDAKTIFVWNWRMNFVSIGQLVHLLEKTLPKIAEAELAVLEDERQYIKEEKMRNLVEVNFADAVKELFRGSGLKYSYEFDSKVVKLTVRLPRKQKMTINLHHARITEEMIKVLPLVKTIHQAVSEMDTIHIRINGYGNKERWIDSE